VHGENLKLTCRFVFNTFTVAGRIIELDNGTNMKEILLKLLFYTAFLINNVIPGKF